MFLGAVGYTALCGWKSKSPQVKCLVVGYTAAYTAAAMVSHSALTNRLFNVVTGICFGLISGVLTAHIQEARQRQAVALARQQQAIAQMRAAGPAPTTPPQVGAATAR